MALCPVYGNPDLFITFTSSPEWPEIATMLAYVLGQKPYDRPEKFVYVIEFQKCGLPHAHNLSWLEGHDKCKTPSEINDVISEDIPSPTHDPDGYKVVTEYMLHGPCSIKPKHVPCDVEGKYSKHFRKSFYAETTLDEDGLAHHRRDSKLCVIKGKFTFTNKDVVHYNHILSLNIRHTLEIGLNKRDTEARITYAEIPKKFVA
ncbi:hypothetical protein OROGR_025810 [Orobanche gracilis]